MNDPWQKKTRHFCRSGRIAKQVGRQFAVDAGVLGYRQGLAERFEIDHQRQIDGEFHYRAVADFADMFDAAAQLVQRRLRRFERRCVAAGHAQQLALTRLRRAATDRTFDERSAGIRDCAGDPPGGRRADGAHLDHQRSRQVGRCQSVGALVDYRRGVVVQNHADHGVTSVRQFSRRRHRSPAQVDERFGTGRCPVPHGDIVAQLEQAFGHRRAHFSGAANTNRHCDSTFGES